MQDAQHFRSQAEFYFELARRMSIDVDAEYFSIQAEHCLARAIELETESAPGPRDQVVSLTPCEMRQS